MVMVPLLGYSSHPKNKVHLKHAPFFESLLLGCSAFMAIGGVYLRYILSPNATLIKKQGRKNPVLS